MPSLPQNQDSTGGRGKSLEQIAQRTDAPVFFCDREIKKWGIVAKGIVGVKGLLLRRGFGIGDCWCKMHVFV